MDRKYGKKYRVRRRADIDRLFESGRRASNAVLVVVAAPNGRTHSRAGVGVGAGHGGAVRRNRAKRLCREAFRLCRADLPAGLDFMLLPRPRAALTLESLKKAIVELAAVVADKINRSERQ